MTSEIGRPRRRWQARHAFLVFLVLSVVAHAAALVALPPLAHEPEPARASALEVVILPPRPLPVARPEPARQPSPLSRAERVPAKALPKPRPERRAPVLALAEPRSTEDAITVAPPRLAEPPATALGPPTKAASDERASPSLNAAYLSNPAPRYPLASRRAGEQGTVTLRILVARDGMPTQVDVEKSSGSRHLDGAALQAVRGWRFAPARRGAEPIESWLLVPVVFRLEGSG